MSDLLTLADEPKREALRRLGWFCAPFNGAAFWRSPDGRLLAESEAFAWLMHAYPDCCTGDVPGD